MDTSRVDQIIQYALALASQEDDFKSRSLGPIHLIKYVYLADLAYAKRRGETFTGARWIFHKFGPWSNQVFSRIEPALASIGAEKKILASSFSEDDYFRWAIYHGTDPETLERHIPAIITTALRRQVHEFASDTSALLHHVYLTEPMLTAAPGDSLNFSQIQATLAPADQDKENAEGGLSNKAQKRRKEQIKSIKAKVQEKIAESLQKKAGPKGFTPPRYDDVFEAGHSWLDSLAGEPIKEEKGEVRFSPEIWRSRFRYDPDLS